MGIAQSRKTQSKIIRDLQEQIKDLQARDSNKRTPPTISMPPRGTGSPGVEVVNFLKKSGDAMFGPIAFNPALQVIDGAGHITIAPQLSGGALKQDTTYVLVTGTGTPDDLEWIDGAQFNGQYLVLQGTAAQVINIKHATTPGTNGNIVTPDGMDIVLDGTVATNGVPVATFIFDVTVVGNGAWRAVSTPATSSSGFLLRDLSNMTAPTAPTVDLNMNNNDIIGVANIDLDGASATIEGVTNLQFFQTSHSINSLAGQITYQVAAVDTHAFIAGGAPILNIEESAASVYRLDMLDHAIKDAKDISFDVDATHTLGTAVPGIGYDTIPKELIYNVPLTAEHKFQVGGATQVTVTDGNMVFIDGFQVIFNPNATNPGVNIGLAVGDPSATNNGDLWYNSSTNKFRTKENGVNVDVVGGGMATDLSNMTAPTAPTVDLNMNNNDIIGIANIDLDGVTATIEGVTNLQFFQTSHSINSLSGTLTYQVAAVDNHSFLAGGSPILSIEESSASVYRLDMLDHAIKDAKDISFDLNATFSLSSGVPGIGYDDDVVDRFIYNVPTGVKHVWTVNGVEEMTLSNVALEFPNDLQIICNPSTSLAGLNVGTIADTSLSVPSNGDIHYDTLTNKFRFYENGGYVELGGGSLGLNDLTDVTLVTPGSGSFLRYNGSLWVNSFILSSDIPANSIGTAELEHQADGGLITFGTSTAPFILGPGSDGEVLTAHGSGAALTWESAKAGIKMYDDGNTYWHTIQSIPGDITVDFTMTDDVVYYALYVPNKDISVSQLAYTFTGGVGGTMYVGIYSLDTTNMEPDSLLVSGTDGIGSDLNTVGITPTTLKAGTPYFFAMKAQATLPGTPPLVAYVFGWQLTNLPMEESKIDLNGNIAPDYGWFGTYTSSGLPTNPSSLTRRGNNLNFPCIYFKVT